MARTIFSVCVLVLLACADCQSPMSPPGPKSKGVDTPLNDSSIATTTRAFVPPQINKTDIDANQLNDTFIEEDGNMTFDDVRPSSKGSKAAAPSVFEVQGQQLLRKQIFAVVSVVGIVSLIALALLQIKIHKNCWTSFKRAQSSTVNKSAQILFALFIVAILMFLTDAAVFTVYIFWRETLSYSALQWTQIMSFVPYQIGKCSMSTFFIARIHFVFKDTPLKIKTCLLQVLVLMSIVAALMGYIYNLNTCATC